MADRPSIFLSHSSIDKEFVMKLGADLDAHGIRVWIDEAEIKIGDSLIRKIREGVDSFDYLAAVISPNSIASAWVQEEIELAMNQQLGGLKTRVLPVLLEEAEMPGFLLGKMYADFTDPEKYGSGLKRIVESVGIVFNRHVLDETIVTSTLGSASDKSLLAGIPMMIAPFHRPTQYLGANVRELHERIGGEINDVGNILVENEKCRLFLEVEGSFVSYGDAEIKTLPAWQISKAFNPELILGAFSISPSELEHVRSQTHCHTYYDHKRKLKITVMCHADGERLVMSFGSKYYGH